MKKKKKKKRYSRLQESQWHEEPFNGREVRGTVVVKVWVLQRHCAWRVTVSVAMFFAGRLETGRGQSVAQAW
jgi:hypothetical protein